jgi:isoleucyl-tRNA synthetase
MDICKDRLYCDAKESNTRRAAQSAMYLIAKSMLALVAPVLTYTADEILEHAPEIFKGDMEDVFDLVYVELPEVDSNLNEELLIKAREAFFESIDKLKKDKVIKTTLEIDIVGDSSIFNMESQKDLQDWFGISEFLDSANSDILATFEVDGKEFSVVKANKHKCPRCWRFVSQSEDELCQRCSEVVS